jgi:hypothetical protein
MSKKENRSISFIYDEMDPSERLEFERDLETDSNLLIEVESLKKVSDRLNSLHEIQPSQEVVEAICLNAIHQKRRTKLPFRRSVFFAAAALLLVGMTSGFFLFDVNNNTSSEENSASDIASMGGNSSILTESVEETTVPSLNSNESSVLSATRTTTTSTTSNTSRVSPWVDNNEVIHFHDRFSAGESASIDSIFRNSMQKLTPVTDPSQSKHFQRNLHLTGSRR